MNRVELQAKLSQEALLVVYDRGSLKYYVDETKVFVNREWKNMVDVFGIYKLDSDNYVCFMTDSERGMPYYADVYDTESEACQELYEMAVRLKAIHTKELEGVVLPAAAENEATVADNPSAEKTLNKLIEEIIKHGGEVKLPYSVGSDERVVAGHSKNGKKNRSKGSGNTSKSELFKKIQSGTLSLAPARSALPVLKASSRTTKAAEKAAHGAAVKAAKKTSVK